MTVEVFFHCGHGSGIALNSSSQLYNTFFNPYSFENTLTLTTSNFRTQYMNHLLNCMIQNWFNCQFGSTSWTSPIEFLTIRPRFDTFVTKSMATFYDVRVSKDLHANLTMKRLHFFRIFKMRVFRINLSWLIKHTLA